MTVQNCSVSMDISVKNIQSPGKALVEGAAEGPAVGRKGGARGGGAEEFGGQVP